MNALQQYIQRKMRLIPLFIQIKKIIKSKTSLLKINKKKVIGKLERKDIQSQRKNKNQTKWMLIQQMHII